MPSTTSRLLTIGALASGWVGDRKVHGDAKVYCQWDHASCGTEGQNPLPCWLLAA
jgi:hypothetical protein